MKISNPTAILGEEAACKFLKNLGYKILERNFRKGYGEIDIVALDPSAGSGQVLVFAEVKTRTSNRFGTPVEQITSWKLRTLVKTAQFYKMTHKNLPDSLRIDAVGILLDGDTVKNIEHIKNISGF